VSRSCGVADFSPRIVRDPRALAIGSGFHSLSFTPVNAAIHEA
jgi:hypothetical protein